MKHLPTVARVLYGLMFLVFAANFFVPFLPPQPPPPPRALAFIEGFSGSGMLTLVKAIELAAAIALLANRFVPLALVLLAPIVVGIAFFHLVLAPEGMPIVIVILAFQLGLAWAHRAAFAPLLRAKAEPAPAERPAPAASLAAN